MQAVYRSREHYEVDQTKLLNNFTFSQYMYTHKCINWTIKQ